MPILKRIVFIKRSQSLYNKQKQQVLMYHVQTLVASRDAKTSKAKSGVQQGPPRYWRAFPRPRVNQVIRSWEEFPARYHARGDIVWSTLAV